MKSLVLGLLMVLSLCAISQNANPNAAKIKFTVKEHDFGDIKEGEKVSFDYKFKNEGKSPLILSNVMIACDCTTSEWPKQPIMPGKEGVIKVMFDSEDKDGQQKKVLVVLTNANNGTERISFTLNVLNDNPTE